MKKSLYDNYIVMIKNKDNELSSINKTGIKIYNSIDGKGYVSFNNGSVKVCESNTSEENRIKFITDLASVCKNKECSNNPEVTYKKLMKEAAPNDINWDDDKLASRCFEFLPVKLQCCISNSGVDLKMKDGLTHYMTISSFSNKLSKFSYLEYINPDDNPDSYDFFIKEEIEEIENIIVFDIYTNMRALLNAGIHYEHIPYNTEEELKEFKVLEMKVPMFVWSHFMTHTQLSKISQSDRTSVESDYWFPTEFIKWMKVNKDIELDGIKDYVLNNMTHNEFENTLKELGLKREIYSRGISYFKYKRFNIAGWMNNPMAWKHLFLERGAEENFKNWTQEETKNIAKVMKHILELTK